MTEVTFHLQIVSYILLINSAVSEIPGRGLFQEVHKEVTTVCDSGLCEGMLLSWSMLKIEYDRSFLKLLLKQSYRDWLVLGIVVKVKESHCVHCLPLFLGRLSFQPPCDMGKNIKLAYCKHIQDSGSWEQCNLTKPSFHFSRRLLPKLQLTQRPLCHTCNKVQMKPGGSSIHPGWSK